MGIRSSWAYGDRANKTHITSLDGGFVTGGLSTKTYNPLEYSAIISPATSCDAFPNFSFLGWIDTLPEDNVTLDVLNQGTWFTLATLEQTNGEFIILCNECRLEGL